MNAGDADGWCCTARQQVPAVTSAAAAYIHPHVDLQSVVPPMTHPAAPAPLGPVLPLSMPQALPAPAAAAGRLADATARGTSSSNSDVPMLPRRQSPALHNIASRQLHGAIAHLLHYNIFCFCAGVGAAAPGGILSHIGNLPAPSPHPGAHAGRVSLPAGLASGGAARLPARVTKSASSPGRFHGRSGSAPGATPHSPDFGPGFHPAAVHRSQSTRIGAMAPSARQAFACECLLLMAYSTPW